MKLDQTYKNIFLGIIVFLVIFGVFKLIGTTLAVGESLMILLLLLIYFEIMDLPKKK